VPVKNTNRKITNDRLSRTDANILSACRSF